MIRLNRGNPPPELDANTVTDLTAEYALSSDSVWNKRYIRDGLLALSSAKCAYCETKINEESKYMEVEHFRCKKDFPHLVVQWDNLLPACKRCNGHKHDYNVDSEGMIADPFSTDPAQHFYFHNYRLRWRDEVGRRTIDTLYLNDSDRLIGVRLKIGEAIAKTLEVIRDKLETYIAGPQTTAKRNIVTRGIENLMREAMPQAEFSALASTVLFSDPNYEWIKENLIALNLWQTLSPLESNIRASALLR